MGERTAADRWQRLLLLAALVLGACLAVWVAGRYLTFAELQRNYRALEAWRDAHLVASVLAYAAIYITAVAFSVPGAVWMTLVGGFLFGVAGGAALVLVSATIGSTLIFLAARTVLSGSLRRRAGGWVERMGRGFRRGEISFLLIMRLIPAVPFFIANLVPAFLGARLHHFVWTTFVGIAPATLVFVSIGSGLGEQLARGEKPDLGVIFEPHILGPLLGLAALAALPLLLRSFGIGQARRGPAE
jgi:uncharacterized membrane protein YdjX (TVP38/TMEM64 family)